jgi:hypothetical protein
VEFVLQIWRTDPGLHFTVLSAFPAHGVSPLSEAGRDVPCVPLAIRSTFGVGPDMAATVNLDRLYLKVGRDISWEEIATLTLLVSHEELEEILKVGIIGQHPGRPREWKFCTTSCHVASRPAGISHKRSMSTYEVDCDVERAKASDATLWAAANGGRSCSTRATSGTQSGRDPALSARTATRSTVWESCAV